MSASTRTPVALFVFNRPDLTTRVLKAVSRTRPATLLVVGDGPRSGVRDDAAKVQATRALFERVDWPCEVRTHYSPTNLGCKLRVSSGLDWVFAQAPQAIVLEDDCLPQPSFFTFCEELLDRYRDDSRVLSIGGSNPLGCQAGAPSTYAFSKYFFCWGWAAWRRSWELFDLRMSDWPQFSAAGGLSRWADSWEEADFWARVLDGEHRGAIDSWAYAMSYACFRHGKLTVVPSRNLVSNVGFRADAVHTRSPDSPLANLATGAMADVVHPARVARDRSLDRSLFQTVFQKRRSGLRRLWHYCRASGSYLRRQAYWRTCAAFARSTTGLAAPRC